MKIPAKVENALKRRVNAALKWWEADYIISDFLNENGIECDSEDYSGGVEAISNPGESADRIREAIRAAKVTNSAVKEKEKDNERD